MTEQQYSSKTTGSLGFSLVSLVVVVSPRRNNVERVPDDKSNEASALLKHTKVSVGWLSSTVGEADYIVAFDSIVLRLPHAVSPSGRFLNESQNGQHRSINLTR